MKQQAPESHELVLRRLGQGLRFPIRILGGVGLLEDSAQRSLGTAVRQRWHLRDPASVVPGHRRHDRRVAIGTGRRRRLPHLPTIARNEANEANEANEGGGDGS